MKKPKIVSGAGFKPEEQSSTQSLSSPQPISNQSPSSTSAPSSSTSSPSIQIPSVPEKKEDPMLSVEPTESEKLSASEVCAPLPPSYYTASDLAGKQPSPQSESSAPLKPKKRPRIVATYDYSLLTAKESKE